MGASLVSAPFSLRDGEFDGFHALHYTCCSYHERNNKTCECKWNCKCKCRSNDQKLEEAVAVSRIISRVPGKSSRKIQTACRIANCSRISGNGKANLPRTWVETAWIFSQPSVRSVFETDSYSLLELFWTRFRLTQECKCNSGGGETCSLYTHLYTTAGNCLNYFWDYCKLALSLETPTGQGLWFGTLRS